MKLHLKRAYDPADPADGFRVYIDRIWPRGLSRLTFRYDMWDKDLAPSTDLRKWFHADPSARWEEFRKKYTLQLRSSPAFRQFMKTIEGKPVVTLLFSSRDRDRNNAVVVRDLLDIQPPV